MGVFDRAVRFFNTSPAPKRTVAKSRASSAQRKNAPPAPPKEPPPLRPPRIVPKAALFTRVSREDQNCANQIYVLNEMAKERCLPVVHTYTSTESAWEGSQFKGLREAIQDARLGLYSHLLVWSLDRLSRQGGKHTIRVLEMFADAGVTVCSYREPWCEVMGLSPEGRTMIMQRAWLAQMESVEISCRTRAAMARRAEEGDAEGKLPPGRPRLYPKPDPDAPKRPPGRPKGSKDLKPRKKRGPRPKPLPKKRGRPVGRKDSKPRKPRSDTKK